MAAAKQQDTKFRKCIISRRTDNIEIASATQKDFVEQAGYVIINGKPTMKNYTVILDVEVSLPETIINYILGRKVPKARATANQQESMVKQYSVEYVGE